VHTKFHHRPFPLLLLCLSPSCTYETILSRVRVDHLSLKVSPPLLDDFPLPRSGFAFWCYIDVGGEREGSYLSNEKFLKANSKIVIRKIKMSSLALSIDIKLSFDFWCPSIDCTEMKLFKWKASLSLGAKTFLLHYWLLAFASWVKRERRINRFILENFHPLRKNACEATFWNWTLV
jgi:hypothetical protein